MWTRKLKNGECLTRKAYSPRQPKITPDVRSKVLRKVNNKKQPSLRVIGRSINISHESVRTILKDRNYNFKMKQKKIKLDSEKKAARLSFATEMEQRASDWGVCFISDETSIWLERAIPRGQWMKKYQKINEESMNDSSQSETEDSFTT